MDHLVFFLNPAEMPCPPHEVRDERLLVELMASLGQRGWDGPPLLVDGGEAITGSHRIAAVDALHACDGLDWTVPAVDVADLAAEHGIDWDALLRDQRWSRYGAALELVERLPATVVNTIGLDVH